MSDRVAELAARVFGVDVSAIHDALSFTSIPEWSSMNHVSLMLALEEELGVTIDEEGMVELTSIAAIRRFVADHQKPK